MPGSLHVQTNRQHPVHKDQCHVTNAPSPPDWPALIHDQAAATSYDSYRSHDAPPNSRAMERSVRDLPCVEVWLNVATPSI